MVHILISSTHESRHKSNHRDEVYEDVWKGLKIVIRGVWFTLSVLVFQFLVLIDVQLMLFVTEI